MAMLSRAGYRRKVLGCWLGKTIGGTLGQPHEGKQELLELTFYDPVPSGAIANDDLDLQLVWLAALREHGPLVDERILGRWWQRSLVYPFDEYGIAKWNLARGLEPPVSGQFANHFTHCMGAPIRSEIWACTAPGCPALAAGYAYCDGCVDHGGEGLYGEMLFAAIESAAFVLDDVDRLLEVGLSFIPPDCRTAGAVRLTRQLHADGLDWPAARERILAEYGDVNFTDAPQNIAFTILGWLWGTDAGDGMCKAVNCGYDTDCTGATLGAILGILGGPEAFEAKWVEPVGDEVVVGWGVVDCETPGTLDELTDWTAAMAEQVLAVHEAPICFGPSDDLSELSLADDQRAALLRERLRRHDWTLRFKGRAREREVTVWVDLGGPPALQPNETRAIKVEVEGRSSGEVTCEVPKGWGVERVAAPRPHWQFLVQAPANVERKASYTLQIVVGLSDVTLCPFSLVPACAWRIAGPVVVPDAAAALDDPPELGPASLRYTADHRLRLDDGDDEARVYRVRTKLYLATDKEARLVAATPGLQQVTLDGKVVLAKTEATRFIPAAHRSGPGTATDAMPWTAGEHEVDILLAVPAGETAELHLFLTRPRDIDGPRLVPWADVVHRVP